MSHFDKKKIHFIGIGGVGMSGIAHVAQEQGHSVSGSDLRESRYTNQLASASSLVSGPRISPLSIPISWSFPQRSEKTILN